MFRAGDADRKNSGSPPPAPGPAPPPQPPRVTANPLCTFLSWVPHPLLMPSGPDPTAGHRVDIQRNPRSQTGCSKEETGHSQPVTEHRWDTGGKGGMRMYVGQVGQEMWVAGAGRGG